MKGLHRWSKLAGVAFTKHLPFGHIYKNAKDGPRESNGEREQISCRLRFHCQGTRLDRGCGHSQYQLQWHFRSSVEQVQRARGPGRSPCWTPASEEMRPMGCHSMGRVLSTMWPKVKAQGNGECICLKWPIWRPN